MVFPVMDSADLVDLDDLPDAAWADVHPASRTRVNSQQHATLKQYL